MCFCFLFLFFFLLYVWCWVSIRISNIYYHRLVFNFLFTVMCRLTFNRISFLSSVQISGGERSPLSQIQPLWLWWNLLCCFGVCSLKFDDQNKKTDLLIRHHRGLLVVALLSCGAVLCVALVLKYEEICWRRRRSINYQNAIICLKFIFSSSFIALGYILETVNIPFYYHTNSIILCRI